jgi:RNA polymerase sigma-70 factor (ECF subfamily)
MDFALHDTTEDRRDCAGTHGGSGKTVANVATGGLCCRLFLRKVPISGTSRIFASSNVVSRHQKPKERAMQAGIQSSSTIDYRTLSDADLAARIAAHDHHAFELLMRRHNQSLYRTARSILKDDAEAEDAVQDAYLLAYRGIGGFRDEARLSTWLTRIVVNEALAKARKRNRRAEIISLGGDAGSEQQESEVNMNAAVAESPERGAMRAQARHLLEKSIDGLPDVFRTVFVLRALEEMSGEEVAACLDIPEATVRTRFFRAKGLLREVLSREIDFAFEEAFSFDGARCDRIVAGVLTRLANPD